MTTTTEKAPGTAHLGDILEHASCLLNRDAEFPRAVAPRIDGRWYTVVFTGPDEVRPQDIATDMVSTSWAHQKDAVQSGTDRVRWARVEAGRISDRATW